MKGTLIETWRRGKTSKRHWGTLGPRGGNSVTTVQRKRAGAAKGRLPSEPQSRRGTAMAKVGWEGG